MRNLKKILALVMALVMSLSLVTIANAADFTDSDDISYEEAVDVMSTIGVINGMDDGSFDPNGTLTREQAAKLVTYMLLGDNAERLGIERSTFKDVAMTRWSAPAIEYCVSLGIIDGAGDGNFYPAGQLTGAAFAKVLLTAIGYDSQKEGLVGASWSVNVSALAAEVGLDNGIEDLSWSAPLTREEAAQMALNAIQAPLVAYDSNATITVNGAEVSIGSGDAYYITTTLAREQRISDRQLSNSDDYTVEFGERYFPRLRLVRETDEFERPSHTWVYENTELGTYVDYDLLTETYTESISGRTLYDLLGRSTIADYNISYYVDGVADDGINANNMIRANTVNYSDTGNGVLTQVFVDHDNEEIIITSINTYLAQANSNYNESSETVSLKVFENSSTGTTKIVDVADVPNIVDLTEDQFVLVNMSGKDTNSATNLEVVKVSDVETMSDVAITKFSTSAGSDTDPSIFTKLTADGEEYSASKKAKYDIDVLNLYDQQLLTDMSYNVYLDQYGYAIGVDLFEGTLNYVFITGYDRGTSHISVKTAQAGAIFLDGSMEEITVNVTNTNKNIDKLNGSDPYFDKWDDGPTGSGGEVAENNWYTYTEANGIYTLKPATRSFATDLASGTVIKSDYVFMDDNAHNVPTSDKGRAWGNDDSIYITAEAGSVDESGNSGTDKDAITDVTGLYTGVQSVEIELNSDTQQLVPNSAYTLYDKDNYIIASVVLGEAQGSVNNYAYILGAAKSEELRDGYYYWEFDAVVDGQKVTLQARTEYSSVFTGLNPYHVQELRYDGEYVTDVRNISNDDIYTNKSLPISGQDIYDVGHVMNSSLLHANHTGCSQTLSNRINGTFTLQGRTLWTNERTTDVGLTFAAQDTPVVLVQKQGMRGGKLETKTINTSLNAVEGLLADANTTQDGTQFRGRIVAALNSQGVAQWAVIISDTPMYIGGGSNLPNAGFDVVTYDSGADRYELRYYGTMYDRSQVEEYLEAYFGQDVTVTAYGASGAGSFYLTNMPLFPMQYVQIRQLAMKVDGVIKDYWDAGTASTVTASGLNSGDTYLLSPKMSDTGADKTVLANGSFSASMTAGRTTDAEFVRAYYVELGANASASYVDSFGATQPLARNNNYYVANGTNLTVSVFGASGYNQFTVNGQPTGQPFTSSSQTMTYRVTDDVTLNATVGGYLVRVDGRDVGVYAGTDDATFTGYQTGSVFAVGKTAMGASDGKLFAAASTNITERANGTFVYDIQPGDADASNVIDLVQVVEVTYDTTDIAEPNNVTYPLSNGTAKPFNSGRYVKVGTTLTITGTAVTDEVIKAEINGNGVATAVPGGVAGNGTTNASATWTLKPSEHSVNFTQSAP